MGVPVQIQRLWSLYCPLGTRAVVSFTGPRPFLQGRVERNWVSFPQGLASGTNARLSPTSLFIAPLLGLIGTDQSHGILLELQMVLEL